MYNSILYHYNSYAVKHGEKAIEFYKNRIKQYEERAKQVPLDEEDIAEMEAINKTIEWIKPFTEYRSFSEYAEDGCYLSISEADDIIESEDEILDEVYKELDEKEEITKEDFIKILENNNNYIIGLNEEDERYSYIENDINQIVKAINHTYRINKLNMVWKQKEANNKKVLANQLRWGFKGYIIDCR